MLNFVSEAAATAQPTLALVSINTGTIVFTLINTLIIFLIFKIFLFKPVGKILDKRKEMAASAIKDAEAAKAAAEAAEKEYNESLANAKAEAAEIVKQATIRAQKREEEIVNEANQKAADIRAKAEENIERDKQRALNEVKDQISELVVMAAGKVVEKEFFMNDNACKVYGDAFFSLCSEEDESSLKDRLDELTELSGIFSENPEFIKLMGTPTVPLEEKISLVEDITKSGNRRQVLL